MQQSILDQICTQIYGEINAILLKHKESVTKKSTRELIKVEIEGYLQSALSQGLISVMPTVRVESDNGNAMVRFYDTETDVIIDAIDKIVKPPVNWSVGKELN